MDVQGLTPGLKCTDRVDEAFASRDDAGPKPPIFGLRRHGILQVDQRTSAVLALGENQSMQVPKRARMRLGQLT